MASKSRRPLRQPLRLGRIGQFLRLPPEAGPSRMLEVPRRLSLQGRERHKGRKLPPASRRRRRVPSPRLSRRALRICNMRRCRHASTLPRPARRSRKAPLRPQAARPPPLRPLEVFQQRRRPRPERRALPRRKIERTLDRILRPPSRQPALLQSRLWAERPAAAPLLPRLARAGQVQASPRTQARSRAKRLPEQPRRSVPRASPTDRTFRRRWAWTVWMEFRQPRLKGSCRRQPMPPCRP